MKTLIFCLVALGLSLGITTVNAGSRLSPGEVEDKIAEAINHHADKDGWANLTKVGEYLDNNDVKVGRLSKFAKKYKDLVEVKVDDSRMPPVTLVKLKATDNDEGN